jgi:hypothetical protein
MSGCQKDEIVVFRQTLEGADFTGRHPHLLSIVESSLTACNFSGLQADRGGERSLGGGMGLTVYRKCVFDGVRFLDVLPGNATFVDCSFKDVYIERLFCHSAQFVGCVFSGTLRSVVFSAVSGELDLDRRTHNEYGDNDFTRAVLDDVSFQGGIDINLQKLPSGDDYITIWNAASVLPKTRVEVNSWPEQELRATANRILGVLESICSTGQRDIFMRRSFLDLRVASGKSRYRLGKLFDVTGGNTGDRPGR